MDRSKIVAILTGAIALLISIGYLLLVQFLDFRGEMRPAPTAGQTGLPPVTITDHVHRGIWLYQTERGGFEPPMSLTP